MRMSMAEIGRRIEQCDRWVAEWSRQIAPITLNDVAEKSPLGLRYCEVKSNRAKLQEAWESKSEHY